jgi:hypothetical protein
MFLSESMLRAFHADRVRDIERATYEHRLVEPLPDADADAPVRRAETPLARHRGPHSRRTSLPARCQAGTAPATE